MKTGIILLLVASLCGCQNPGAMQTMSKITNGAEDTAPIACAVERIFLHDPTLGTVCATLDEFERAKKAVGSDNEHDLCACILEERALTAAKAGAQ